MSKSTGQILLDAADYLVEHGWFQGGMFDWGGLEALDNNPAACALGAVQQVRREGGTFPLPVDSACPARTRLAETVRRIAPPVNGDSEISIIAEWNDAPDRTKEEVVDALREAADGV